MKDKKSTCCNVHFFFNFVIILWVRKCFEDILWYKKFLEGFMECIDSTKIQMVNPLENIRR